jgi:hypothetical protein
MFSKKPTPDFSPRPQHVRQIYTPPPAPKQDVALPEKIVISESAKLPVAPPPPIITHQAAPVAVKKAVTFAAPPAPSLAAPLPPQQIAGSAFSPSLETFTGTGQSYFTLAGTTVSAESWWKYPAGGTVDISGNTLTQVGQIIATEATISTLAASEVDTSYLSCLIGTISSFSTSLICLDGATLTTAGGTELLLNGIPLATTSNISSLADWSFDPAVSTLNMNGNPILGASDIQVSSINGGGLSSFSAASWASYPAVQYVDMNSFGLVNVSTINGTIYPPPASGVTSLNGQTGGVSLTSAGNTVTITSPVAGTINLETAAGGGGADWANYPAVSTVILPNRDFNMSNTAGGLGSFNTAFINANVEIGALSNAPNRPTFNAYPDYFNVGSIVSPALGMTFTSLGGVNINSALGVSLAGGGGVAITGVGGINLQGGGAINVASGGILVSGGGIAITAGGLAVNGGGLQVGAGGMAITGGNVDIATSTSMGTQTANGGEFTLYGNNLRLLSTNTTASALLTDNIGSASYANTMRITGVSTINNVPFPPPIPGLAMDLICSTLTAANYISTPAVTTNIISGTGVIIQSETGHGITIGTAATEVNMTADVFVDAPRTLNAVNIANVSSITAGGTALNIAGGSAGIYLNTDTRIRAPNIFYPETIEECVSAGIDELNNVSSINSVSGLSVGQFGTASSIMYVDQIAPRGGTMGTPAQFLGVFNNRILWVDITTINTAPTWSQYVATQTVNFDTHAITGVTQLTTSTITTTALQDSAGQYGTAGQFLGADSTGKVVWQTGGGSSSYFNYQAETPPGVPASGHISWQSTAQTTSTYVRASHINYDGADIELFLSAVQPGNTLILQNLDDSTNFQKWTVTATPTVVVNNYVQYPVTLVSSAGADFNNNHRIILAIIAGVSPVNNTALTNKVIANSVGSPTSTALTWSASSVGNQYVPLAADTSVTFRPPVAPVTGTGWRFTKTYNLITVATSGLTTGATYSIVTPGSINWTAIGAAAATAGTQFTYTGAAITGTGGTAVETSKISWYPLNLLYGLSLPQTTIPSGAVSKANLQNAWFLVKFNADIALQGSLAIQIDTYAYQYSGNTTNGFTGRWAYSFPLQQGLGFNASATTNITAGGNPGLFSGRLRAGFTYLLYAGDYTTVGAAGPLQPASTQYLPAGAGLFAPSQALIANTLKDPYDVYPEYPHFGLTSCLYTANATQPPYGGANPYSDQAAVEVASIYLNTNSTSPSSGVGQTVTDFQVMAMGYTTSSGSVEYSLAYV